MAEEFAYPSVDGTRNGYQGESPGNATTNLWDHINDPHGSPDITDYIRRTPTVATEMRFTLDMSGVSIAAAGSNIHTVYVEYRTSSGNITTFNQIVFLVTIYESGVAVTSFTWVFIGTTPEESGAGSTAGLLRFTGGISSYANTITIGLSTDQNTGGLANNEGRYMYAHLSVQPPASGGCKMMPNGVRWPW